MLFGGILILRVISGDAKGHKLKTIKGITTRPTTDKVKGSLFNILVAYIEDSRVLDLFSGTGSLGIEALSRGAASSVFIDQSRECTGIIKENLIHTKLIDRAEIYNMQAEAALNMLGQKGKKFDIVFLDPPYCKNYIQEVLINLDNNDIIVDSSIIIAEHSVKDTLSEEVGRLEKYRSQKYGDTMLSFYRIKESGR